MPGRGLVMGVLMGCVVMMLCLWRGFVFPQSVGVTDEDGRMIGHEILSLEDQAIGFSSPLGGVSYDLDTAAAAVEVSSLAQDQLGGCALVYSWHGWLSRCPGLRGPGFLMMNGVFYDVLQCTL